MQHRNAAILVAHVLATGWAVSACSGDDVMDSPLDVGFGGADTGTTDLEIDLGVADLGAADIGETSDGGQQDLRLVSSMPAAMSNVASTEVSPMTFVFSAAMNTTVTEIGYSVFGGGDGLSGFGDITWSDDARTAMMTLEERAGASYTVQINAFLGASGERLPADGEVDPFGKPILTFTTQ